MHEIFPTSDQDLDRVIEAILHAVGQLSPEEAAALFMVIARHLAVEIREPLVADRLADEYQRLAARIRLVHSPVAGHA